MYTTKAYEEGFRKVAAEAGIDPDMLVKFAGIWGAAAKGAGMLPKLWNALKASGGVVSAAKGAVVGSKATKAAPTVTRAANKAREAWKAVPGATATVHGLRAATKIPGAKLVLPTAASYLAGRVGSSSGKEDAAGSGENQPIDQMLYPSPDYLGNLRTADSIMRLFGPQAMNWNAYGYPGIPKPFAFNMKPYIPRWQKELGAQ